MKYLLACCILFLFSINARTQTRPKIGLVLSGGGAKGLAHIGILKAIDSAGLQVNYITGTSMGSIIGALYACGYSADSIEKIVSTTDWDLLFTNSASLRSLILEEKDEYDKYAIELPWLNRRFLLPGGVLESEELWLKFSEFFFPVHNIKNFSKLPRPFNCIATDVATGEAVVLDSGEIVSAVRASMAIPSVFTPVDYNGRKFIDGGVVRNFPVSDVKAMGANFIIGSNVAGGLLAKEKINNVFQVLMQVAFFRNDADFQAQKKLCNIYIHHDLADYNMASFSSSDEIINEGIKKGDSVYATLKHLNDSLNAIYGTSAIKKNLLPNIDSVKITAYAIKGLVRTSEQFFLNRILFQNNQWYTASSLSADIRRAFGTRYYQKIVYSLETLPDGTCKIIFDVEENPLTFAKLGINYNSFMGISLVGNLTARNFFTPYSRSMVTINVGENMRIKAEHLQFIGKYKTVSVAASTQAEYINFNSYNNFVKDGLYQQGYFLGDLHAQWALKSKYSMGIGTRFEAFYYKPEITSKFELRGSNSLVNSYVFIKLNTLSNNIYPKNGTKVDLEAGYVYDQDPKLKYLQDGQPITNLDSLGFNFSNFIRTRLNIERYVSLTKKYTLFTQEQAGINFNQRVNILNDYFIGGLNYTFLNQITFAGLNEATEHSSSVATFALGLRYEMYSNLFLIGRVNALYYNFIGSDNSPGNPYFLSGASITLGYKFILGPLEISAMYCNQAKQVIPYINLGIPF